jgi:HNH endonuclease
MPTERVTVAQRRVVRERAHDHCEYCRIPGRFATQTFTVEHIAPRAAGGATVLGNLAWACFGCNAHKHTATHGTDPGTTEDVALFHPRQQRWSEHFAWSADLVHVVGKTPSGRATIDVLHLNRAGLVNLRRVLVTGGDHPPSEE